MNQDRDPQPADPLTTRWSRIEKEDYDYLVRRFWKPIRRFLSQYLPTVEEAEDATQDLFLSFVEKHWLLRADKSKGSFRTFLFHVARQFVIDYQRVRSAAKRGADRQVPLEGPHVDGREPPPEAGLEEEWYWSLLNDARRRLKTSYEDRGRPEAYQAFRSFFFGDDDGHHPSYQAIAERLGTDFRQVKNDIYRAKRAFLEEVRRAIGEYSRSEEEFEAELVDLRRFLDGIGAKGAVWSTVLDAPLDAPPGDGS